MPAGADLYRNNTLLGSATPLPKIRCCGQRLLWKPENQRDKVPVVIGSDNLLCGSPPCRSSLLRRLASNPQPFEESLHSTSKTKEKCLAELP